MKTEMYKVGDRVEVVDDYEQGCYSNGDTGTVVFLDDDETFLIRFDEHMHTPSNPRLTGQLSWYASDDMVTLVE